MNYVNVLDMNMGEKDNMMVLICTWLHVDDLSVIHIHPSTIAAMTG